MSLDQWHRCKEIFVAARELPYHTRDSYLDQACSGDLELRRRVERLLAADDTRDDLLSQSKTIRASTVEFHPSRVIGLRLKDRYVIESELAEGGLGVVYLARDELLHSRSVVVKFPTAPQVGSRTRTRWFDAEIEALARINDPGVVGILDAGESSDGRPFLVMQYVAGKTLRACLTGGPFEPARAEVLVRQMARGLDSAHAEGVCHLDLKPENVMLLNAGSREERAVIIDFGIARFLQGGQPGAQARSYGGSPSYMAPEQFKGTGGAASDIYSLGVMAMEMLTGVRPQPGESTEFRLGQLPAGNLRRARAALARAMREEASQRYSQAMDFAEALALALLPGKRRLSSRWIAAAAIAYVLMTGMLFMRGGRPEPENFPEPVLFTSSQGEERFPSISADGKEVYFSYQRNPDGPGDIYVQPVAGGRARRLTSTPVHEFCPVGSPDGKLVGFLRQAESGRAQIVFSRGDGGGEKLIAEGLISGFAWHPSGKWLAVSERQPNARSHNLYALMLESGKKTQLTEGERYSSGDRDPVFSGDGAQIAYVCASPRVDGNVCVLSVRQNGEKNGVPRRITDLNQPASRPAWWRDGNDIVFTSGAPSREVFWRSPAAGGSAPVRMPIAVTGVDSPVVHAGQNILLFARKSTDRNIWRMDLTMAGSGREEVDSFIASTVEDSAPLHSPDGNQVAFVSDRTGFPEVWLSDRDGSEQRQLTALKATGTGRPVWSPDSASILFHSNAEGNSELYAVSAFGGLPRRLTKEASRETSGAWSPDGQWVYFVSDRSGRDEIWRMPAGGGEAVQMSDDNGGAPSLSADGEYLYYVRRMGNAGSLIRKQVNAAKLEVLVPDLHHRIYALGSRGIYYAARPRSGAGCTLKFYRFEDRSTRQLAELNLVPRFGLSVSPDGKEILYAQEDQSGNDLYLIRSLP